MQKWQHMAVHLVTHHDEEEGDVIIEKWTATAPDYKHRDQDVEPDYRRGDEAVRLMDELGDKGWELSSTDIRVVGSSWERTFWLKRPSEIG